MVVRVEGVAEHMGVNFGPQAGGLGHVPQSAGGRVAVHLCAARVSRNAVHAWRSGRSRPSASSPDRTAPSASGQQEKPFNRQRVMAISVCLGVAVE
jgi:hypothetical protein